MHSKSPLRYFLEENEKWPFDSSDLVEMQCSTLLMLWLWMTLISSFRSGGGQRKQKKKKDPRQSQLDCWKYYPNNTGGIDFYEIYFSKSTEFKTMILYKHNQI